LDLLIWPETLMLARIRHNEAAALIGSTLIVVGDGDVAMFMPPGNVPKPEVTNLAKELNRGTRARAAFLLGVEFQHDHLAEDEHTIESADDYNSSLFIDAHGQVLGRYDKMHAVIFGEYMPLGDYFPWLYQLSPLRDGLCEGKCAQAFELGGVRFCPSICYESILPHEVRGAVARLRAERREPDVLVNQTNSGWFWGSSELDLHLACNVLRAVECRKPMLVAANTGISAWIDDTGAIREQGPRRAEGIVYATVGPLRATSVYTYVGDWPAGLCLIACGLAALIGLQGRWTARRSRQRVS
jgi:apolipoprotein N-acyltransferase